MAKKVDFRKRPQDEVYTLHVSLPGTTPLVWRRIMVPGLFTLEKLNPVIQLTMGWQMKHLYDFHVGSDRFAEPDDFDETPVKGLAATITAAVRDAKTFSYNYDFGDDWRHTITVEKISAREKNMSYPICVGGENACPPEDCGGFPGFEELKEKVADKKHPEHAEIMMWLGGYYDPRSFDANRINRDMLWMIDWEREPNDQGLYLPFNSEADDEKHRLNS